MIAVIQRNPIKTVLNYLHNLSHCNNCHAPLKPKAWRGRSLGLCYKCFKKWERFELREDDRKQNDPRHQRLSKLIGMLTFTKLTREERAEYDSLLDELSKEDDNIATLKLFVDTVQGEIAAREGIQQ